MCVSSVLTDEIFIENWNLYKFHKIIAHTNSLRLAVGLTLSKWSKQQMKNLNPQWFRCKCDAYRLRFMFLVEIWQIFLFGCVCVLSFWNLNSSDLRLNDKENEHRGKCSRVFIFKKEGFLHVLSVTGTILLTGSLSRDKMKCVKNERTLKDFEGKTTTTTTVEVVKKVK